MTTPKSLPARPSLESLRKQAKKLARAIDAGDAAAIARVRAQLPQAELPLSQRDAQFVLAREYGFAGWQALLAEVQQRLGGSLEWAAVQARRIIHDNDVAALRQLLAEHPALLTWQGEEGGLLGMATSSFGDSFDPERERHFTRAACAELLIDAGAIVVPSVCHALVEARARGLLQLFERKGLLPHTLEFRAALGAREGVRACVGEEAMDVATVNAAFFCACNFQHEEIAGFLLERSTALDPTLAERVAPQDRADFIRYLMAGSLTFTNAKPQRPLEAFHMHRVVRAIHDDDLKTFIEVLHGEAWLLGEAHVPFQVGLIERAILRDRGPFIPALLNLDPVLVRRRPPPQSKAVEMAFTYAKPHLLPLLTPIWRIPDDLPHAAGRGDLAAVKRWFDASGKPALGDLIRHFPAHDAHTRANLQWGAPSMQQVLDTALAFAVINGHFEVADFLLAHGADINTRWSSHEPASILHELVFHENYAAMQFLIERGIDMTIVDYRWRATAEGWAYHAAKNEKLARWLAHAQRAQIRN